MDPFTALAIGGTLVSAGMSYKAGYTAKQQSKLNAKREEYRSRAEAETRKLQAQQRHEDLYRQLIVEDATNVAMIGVSGRDISDRSI